MHIGRIRLRNFMRHVDTTLRIPSVGILLVTGDNGGGKSAMTSEAVSSALFGKTLRSTSPWTGADGSVEIDADTVHVAVTKKGSGSPKVVWSTPGSKPVVYDTPTKARAALASVIGSFDTWKRIALFSASDAAHFSLATDAERKVLIERLLGYERLDAGLKACRAELKQSEQALSSLRLQQATADERVRGLVARIADAEAASPVAAEPPTSKHVNGALMEIQALRSRQSEIAAVVTQAVADAAAADADLRTASREQERLDADACPTCGAEMAEDHRKSLRQAVANAKAKAAAAREEAAGARKCADVEQALLADEIGTLSTYIANAKAAKAAWDAAQAETERRAKKLTELRQQLDTAIESAAGGEAKIAVMVQDVAELTSVESVLGLRGVRVHLLGQALRALTALANARLAQLLPGAALQLLEDSDKLVMRVTGVGHSEGYDGCSSGERRRIDLSVLFALGTLEALSRGVDEGTLFLDEVADTLDPGGIDAVADLLVSMAKTRAVVLITHNKDLIAAIEPHAVARAHVREGRLT